MLIDHVVPSYFFTLYTEYEPMHLLDITVANYNNYDTVAIKVHSKMNALTGLNGMGKTNLLDAIYYLCLGKSYFNSSDRHVVRHGEEFFRVQGAFETKTGKETVEIKVSPGRKKEIVFSGKKRDRLSDHIGTLPCVIIAPDDIQLMLEGSEERRKFLDNTLMQYDPVYVADIIAYNRLLKQRNALLKTFAEKHYYDQSLVDSISNGMYEPAARIFAARKKLVEGLSPLFEKYYGLISDEREHCAITYKSSLEGHTLQELFAQNMEKDKILTRTTTGIHKDDILFKMNDIQLKNFASQGQLKSFVLSLKLAQYEVVSSSGGTLPILILDDIFDKLDRDRVGRLLQLLSEDNFGQIFISDTNEDRVPGILAQMNLEHQSYVVHGGTVKYRTQ